MNEKLALILNTLGSMRVDGWENLEKLVYIKLLIEELMKNNEKGE